MAVNLTVALFFCQTRSTGGVCCVQSGCVESKAVSKASIPRYRSRSFPAPVTPPSPTPAHHSPVDQSSTSHPHLGSTSPDFERNQQFNGDQLEHLRVFCAQARPVQVGVDAEIQSVSAQVHRMWHSCPVLMLHD